MLYFLITATPSDRIYTLSLHDALPIYEGGPHGVVVLGRQVEVDDCAEEGVGNLHQDPGPVAGVGLRACGTAVLEVAERSEEHTSELQSHVNLVCRLLLEKKN